MQDQNPLVSIIVITYNSAKFVLETLESARAQTYENIELIVSDDCSTDNTVEICRQWIEENKERFVRSELITVPENTGIPANCNRGVKAANGEWVKFIAGDDILLLHCIESLIDYSLSQPNAKVFFSRMQSFYVEDSERKYGKTSPYPKEESIFSLNAKKQYKYLLTKSFNIAPTSLINKDLIIHLGGFDEQFRYVEDLPMWLKISKAGYKMRFKPEVTVLYRKHDNAITSNESKMYNILFCESLHAMKKKYIYPEVPVYDILFWQKVVAQRIKYKILTKWYKNQKNETTERLAKLLDYLDIIHLRNIVAGKILKIVRK